MTDLTLWIIVGLAACIHIVGLAKPTPPAAPTWVNFTSGMLALPLMVLWVLAAWQTGYWQLAVIPASAVAIAVTGGVAKAAK